MNLSFGFRQALGTVVLAVLISAAIVAALEDMSRTEKAAAARKGPSLKDLPGVGEVIVGGRQLRIDMALRTAWVPERYVELAGRQAELVGRKLQDGPAEDSPDVQMVVISYSAPGAETDRRRPFMELTYSASDLRRINFNDVGVNETLAMARDAALADESARKAANAWCAARIGDLPARVFCNRLR